MTLRGGDDLVGDQRAVVGGDLPPPLQEQPLDSRSPRTWIGRFGLKIIFRASQSVNQPTTRPNAGMISGSWNSTHSVICSRPIVPPNQMPDRAMKRNSLLAGLLEDPVQQRLVGDEVGDHHVLEVEHRRRRRAGCRDSTSRTIRGVSAWARATISARTGAGRASQTPGWYSAMISRVISFGGPAHRLGDLLRDPVGIEARDHLVGRDQVAGHGVDGDARHPRGPARHDALPAQVGAHADELAAVRNIILIATSLVT